MNGIEEIGCGFEGAEKKIEIDFCRDPSNPEGLRTIPQSMWEEILEIIKCQIISSTKNEHFDSYVLSESSLFVYPYKVIIKTCGTTILLRCLDPILTMAENECGLSPEFVFFARKNLLYPEKQHFPHAKLEDELEVLNQLFEDGNCYTFGSHTSDNWVLYYVDLMDDAYEKRRHNDQTFEILMTHLDERTMDIFYANEQNIQNPKEVTRASGIGQIIPTAITDEKMFEPCGYSVNGLADDAYFTIHVTPEDHCSFASFETNISRENYTDISSSVIESFKPGKFTITLFSDDGALCASNPLGAIDLRTIKRMGYTLKNRTFTEYHGSTAGTYSLLYLSFESQNEAIKEPVVGGIREGAFVRAL